MIRHVTDAKTIQQAVAARRGITDGPANLSEAWLASDDRVVIAEESGVLLDPEDTPRLETAFNRFNVTTLLAVDNDPLIIDNRVYELDSTAKDLDSLSAEVGGISILVVAKGRTDMAVLCTVDDFRLVAGPREFILSYTPDPVRARSEFLEFAEQHPVEDFRLLHQRAAAYMSWVDRT